jgi:hypothetical protein
LAGWVDVHGHISGQGEPPEIGLVAEGLLTMCRGAVSGGTGDDHMRSSADTALERRRRRAQILVAVIVMAGRYTRAGHFRQPGTPRSYESMIEAEPERPA